MDKVTLGKLSMVPSLFLRLFSVLQLNPGNDYLWVQQTQVLEEESGFKAKG